jgi:hypothetical protein
MKTVEIPVDVYEHILKTLQRGVNVCYNVDYSDESHCGDKSPSYATGYSRATMQEVIKDLNYWKTIKD